MRETLHVATLLLPCTLAAQTLVPTPPMGWNSWDSYGTTLTEAQFKANADVLASALLPYGYNIATIDIEWYTPHPPDHGHYIPDPANVTLDPYGRFVPAPNRFPSSAGTDESKPAGFTPLADYAHAKGLKFGIHIMRGIPREAVARNLPIESSPFHAADIADPAHSANWTGMTDTYGIDMSKPGAQAYYDSIVRLYASWGVDYIKADDMSQPFHAAEIEALHKAIANSGRPIILSLSPGPAPIAERELLAANAQLWRISGDFWDRWPDIQRHFELMQAWQPYVQPGHWPDADMLPLGHLAIHGEVGVERDSRLTHEEQRTLINLWAIFRSPLIIGGDLTALASEPHQWTLSLLTNKAVLEMDQHSQGNKAVVVSPTLAIWTAEDPPAAPYTAFPHDQGRYVAVFNRKNSTQSIRLSWESLGITPGAHVVSNLWEHKPKERQTQLKMRLPPHASALFWVGKSPIILE